MHQLQHNTGFNKNILLFIIILTSVVNPFLGAAVNIALPKIGEEFSMNAITMSWVAMAFLLSSAVFLVPLGKAADILGRKKIFLFGSIIIALSSLGCAFATSGTMLIVFRVLQGFGSAMTFATGMAILTSAFPPHERGKALGINVSAVYLGLSVAPFIGGILTQTLGWRSLFLATLPFAVLVIAIIIFTIKVEWAEAKHEKFDYTGSLVYTIAISALMYGFSKLPEPHAFIVTGSGLVGLAVFTRVELRQSWPVLNIDLFRNNRVFAFSNLAALINYAATFAVSFILSLYLQYSQGLSPLQAGSILVTQPFVMMLVASISGRLSDTYDSRILSSLGMGITVTGLVMLSFLDDATGKTYIITSLVVLGTGFGLFSAPNTNAVMGSVTKKHLGVASATVGTMRLTGQMMSMGIATMILNIFIGKASIGPENQHLFLSSVKVIFLLFGLLCFMGVFASLARGKRQRSEK
ncbi:MAG: MFS transporter [Bacteroidales bacterium]|nr:MFS transporter [Bacteroidales bacterium]